MPRNHSMQSQPTMSDLARHVEEFHPSTRPRRQGYVLVEGKFRDMTKDTVSVLGYRAPLRLECLKRRGTLIFAEASYLKDRK